MKFLLVDDHQIIREGLKLILQIQYPSAQVDEGSSADEVMDKGTLSGYDVVICDVSMPGRNGIDFVKHVKELKPGLPVLILTMHPEKQYALRAIKAGAAGYINKASGVEELLLALERVLTGRKYISKAVGEMLAENLDGSDAQLHEKLSDREFSIFKLIAEGKSLSEIGEDLSLSISTVSTHRSRILTKLKMKGNADIIKYALEHKLI